MFKINGKVGKKLIKNKCENYWIWIGFLIQKIKSKFKTIHSTHSDHLEVNMCSIISLFPMLQHEQSIFNN